VTLPSKETLLERESRWLRPAGILAIVGALVFAAGQVIPQVGLAAADTDAERLAQFHDHAGRFILGQTLQGLGFALFAAPLFVLLEAAAGRAERVRRGLIPFAFLGPILIGVSSVVLAVGFKDAADSFAEKEPGVVATARQEAETAEAKAAKGGAEPKPSEEAAEPKPPDEAADDAREELADDVIDDAGTLKAGAGLRLPAFLSLVFGLIYIPLWAMRTGLLTRFWATLGMALGAALILIGPLAEIGMVMWFAVLGLMLAGWWPGPRPPAWEAGEAIPWPKPGEDLGEPAERGGTVEGSGREVSEPPLPEPEGGEPPITGEDAGQAHPRGGETQGQRRKKRKRRG
jgi:hypothetical protein